MSKSPRAVRGGDMGKITATAFITLDNVVEDPHLWSGEFQSEDTGEYNTAVLRDADAMLLGRVTYEGFAAAWPSRSGDYFSDRFNSMPKYVVTSTLETADWDNTTIVSDDAIEQVRKLRDEQNLLIWGSPTLVQSLLDAGLVDELVLLYSPLVRGKGIRLFREGQDHKLRVADATVLSGGMLGLRLEA
jgi:dihydrofolate reductase